MIDDVAVELIPSIIGDLLKPGNTGAELLCLAVLIALIVWGRSRKK